MVNPFEMLKNFQQMQQQMQSMQKNLQSFEVSSATGADLVRVTMSGDLKVRRVDISPEIFTLGDAGMLEDLVLSAFTDAMAKIQEHIREEYGELGGSLPIGQGE